MRRLKVGIRPQLIVLVCFASLLSLLILGIVTGLYFSDNLTNLRGERLYVISQLKTAQVQQAVAYVAYQVGSLASIDSITTPLSQYRAGNNSRDVFVDAQETLEQFMTSTETFAAARLYNLDLEVMASSYNNITTVSTDTADLLFPLKANASIPAPLLNTNSSEFYFTGPLANISKTDVNSPYFMGVTLPVYANSSILINQPYVAGYLSVVASAATIQEALNVSTEDYSTIAVKPIFGTIVDGLIVENLDTNIDQTTNPAIGFEIVFPSEATLIQPGVPYSINASDSIKTAIESPSGVATNVKAFAGFSVAIGYTQIYINNLLWDIIVVQRQSVFDEPVEKLKKIIIGVVIGIGAFMCLITFPLAVWFIRPITKLKESTEAITGYKKEKGFFSNKWSNRNTLSSGNNDPDDHHNDRHRNNKGIKNTNGEGAAMDEKFGGHESVLSSTGGESIQYSTGIKLPMRIVPSKKIFKDELTELSEAFNIMTDELDKQYTHLEDRVKLRTKELEASKLEAEAANEAKTVFIANISHELRTPLNGILGMTSIAMEEKDHSKIQDSLKLIQRSGELLLHILTELLTYSKNTLNRSKLEKSDFQILEIVYQIRSIFNKSAQDQGVNFKMYVKPNALRKLILFGDSNRIIQIIMNLVSNSLKFTPIDGNVDVVFKLLGEYDAATSKACDYEKVRLFNNPKYPPPPNTSRQLLHPEQLQQLQHGKPHKRLNSVSSRISRTSQATQGKRQLKTFKDSKNPGMVNPLTGVADGDEDNISLVTMSTSQYEDALFEQQFLSNSKSLPKAPSNVEYKNDFTEECDDGNKDENSVNQALGVIRNDSDITKISSLASKESIVATQSKGATEFEGTTPTIEPKTQTRHYVMPKEKDYKSYPTLDKKELRDSTDKTFVNGRVSYPIRPLYLPRSWVLQISVTDTGPGIEPALQDKVFEPFVQGDQTLSRSYGGTGLGLSICRQLAKMMNGTLTLKSTIGQGSTFTLAIPLPQTGEIAIPADELAQMCQDEFNPDFELNNKAVIEEIQEEEGDSKEGSSTRKIDNITSIGDGVATSSSSENGSSRHEQNITFKSTAHKIRPSLISHGSSPAIITTSTCSSTNSVTKTSSILNFEKSQAFSQGSTGTANVQSASGAGNVGAGPSEGYDNSLSSVSTPTHPPSVPVNSVMEDIFNLKILVAEDNHVNQEVIKRMLKLEGFNNLTMAANGAEAVEFVKNSLESESSKDQFDLIFMDIQMPIMDGITAVNIIRQNLKFTKPIIALTAFADDSNIKECYNAGMNGFLSKPIKRTNLRTMISKNYPILLKEVVVTPHSISSQRSSYFPNVT